MYNFETIEKPTLVISGNKEQFERYCMEHKLTRREAAEIRQPTQLSPEFYAMDCPLVTTGDYWLNEAYNSKEYKERLAYLSAEAAKAQEAEAMRFGSGEGNDENLLRETLRSIANNENLDSETRRRARVALGEE